MIDQITVFLENKKGRVASVARTIADLDGAETIGLAHLAEAIQYRTYDFSVAEP